MSGEQNENAVTAQEKSSDLGKEILESRRLNAGDENYRAYVGPPRQYDYMSATQFSLAFHLGLREEHYYLDVGCGSLRSGKLLMQFLMPGRYHGMEPNSWLWQTAFEKEIGQCVRELKAPSFSDSDNFEFSTFNQKFDFIVSQSIFSHTALDLFTHALGNASAVMLDTSQFLFTVLSEGTRGFGELPNGKTASGWIYPGCVTFEEDYVIELAREQDLLAQKISWFHPRQQWFRAVKSENMLIEDPKKLFAGGAVHFDPRFT